MRWMWLVGVLASVTAVAAVSAPAKTPVSSAKTPVSEAQADFFETKVRPVLVESCVKCHGPATQSAGLRLDSRAAILKGGARGPAVVPGSPAKSLLVQAVQYSQTLRMPPSKQLPAAQLAAIAQWVKQGAPWPDAKPGAAPPVSLWSLKPVKKPAVPRVKNAAWVRNPIDAFVLAKLESKGMVPAPPTPKLQLMRRLYFDLTGLPPTPEEVKAYLADRDPQAYEKLVDRLLASPRYGERWARYWLDLVRYADTNGYERDAEKKYSWKYRDYVIHSLNSDKPYDRFITEQLAGDEMPGRSEETLTATGFLRLGTWDDEPNDALEYRYERLDDLVHTTATAFLALTVKCARCHDHKFDPIRQKDYYAFGAAFYGGYLEGGVMGGPPDNALPYPVLGFTDKGREAPPLHLLEKGDVHREADVVEPGFLSAIQLAGHAPEPSAADAKTTGRRLRLAQWLTDPAHPLTARVLVNRLWQHHFGAGIVRSANNFGMKGDAPTHPELLDWLAATFRGPAPGYAWHIKPLQRLIVLSNTYRMASQHPQEPAYSGKDAANDLLWRQNRRRLDADAMRDSMLAVSGELNLAEGGPGFVPTVQREALEGLSRKGAEWVPSAPEEQRRRTVYMFLKRALIMPLLTVFDFPDTTQPIEARDSTLVPTQALTLLNNPFVHEQSDALARRVAADAGPDPGKRVDRAWELAFGRLPSATERAAALEHLKVTDAGSKRAVLASKAAPGEIPLEGLALRLRADEGVTADSEGRVSAWHDGGAGSHNATQPDAAARPLLVPAALNGKPVLRFDGKGRFLRLDGQVLTSQRYTLFAVVNDNAPGSGHREIFSDWNSAFVPDSFFFGLTGNSIRLTDHFSPAGAISQPQRHFVLTGVSGAEGAVLFQDRREAARRQVPIPARKLDTPYVIGQQGNINGEFWNGDIAELVVYNRELSDAEREQVWDALSLRYGIAVRPPAPDPGLASLCRVLLNSNEFIYVD